MGRRGWGWEEECYGQEERGLEEGGLEEAREEKAHVGLEQAGRASWKRKELDQKV